MIRIGQKPPRHRFILNPYAWERFARCPECEKPTEQRKFPLVVHIDPRELISLNKTCCYCPRCYLLIAHQDELEAQLAALFQERRPEVIGNDYLVIGTLDTEVWQRGQQTLLTIQETLDSLHDFADVRRIEPTDEHGNPLEARPGKARHKGDRPQPGRGRHRQRRKGN